MQAEEVAGAAQRLGQVVDAQPAGVAGQQHRPSFLGFGEDPALEFRAFGNRFDQQVGLLGQLADLPDGMDAARQPVGPCGIELAALPRQGGPGPDGLQRPVRPGRIGLRQRDLATRRGEDIGDAHSHGPGPDDPDSLTHHHFLTEFCFR